MVIGNEVWKGIRSAAEKKLEIRKIWRMCKGKWFAVVEKMISEPEPSNIARQITIEFRECCGKAEAIEAARELLARHAIAFDERVEVQARICPEIE